MAIDELLCWNCGKPLNDISLPLSRLAKCKSCKADLHVCRLCLFYDRTVSKQCREPIAEEVQDKSRSNFCGYLQTNPKAYSSEDSSKASAAKAELDSLFGLNADPNDATNSSDPDIAKQRLNELFNIGEKKN